MRIEKEKDVFRKMKEYIVEKEMYRDEKLNRDTLRKLVKLSKNNFAPMFEKYAGTSFISYVNGFRMKRAEESLKTKPQMSISEIAIDCGIPKIQTFYRLFQLHFGMPPAQYRKLHAEKTLSPKG